MQVTAGPPTWPFYQLFAVNRDKAFILPEVNTAMPACAQCFLVKIADRMLLVASMLSVSLCVCCYGAIY